MNSNFVDPTLMQEAMRHAVGRGIAPVPSVGGGLGVRYSMTQSLLKGKKNDVDEEAFGKELMKDLKKKIVNI